MPVIHINGASDLESQLSKASNKLSVLDFTAKWCGPCQRIAPDFERLSEKFKSTKFFKIDVDECPDVAGNYNVRSMPTFIFIKNSKELERFTGADLEQLESNISKHGGDNLVDAFTGTGQTLSGTNSNNSGIGGWLGSLIGGSGSSDSDGGGNDEENEKKAKEIFPIDRTQTVSKVQVRLADGKRLQVELNSSATVGTLRDYISVARPRYSEVPFSLLTVRPNKTLEDESITLEEAQLSNSVVNVKINK